MSRNRIGRMKTTMSRITTRNKPYRPIGHLPIFRENGEDDITGPSISPDSPSLFSKKMGRAGVGPELRSTKPANIHSEDTSLMRPHRTTPKLLQRAAEQRKEPTPTEARLWAYLRALREDGIHFRRQHAIGSYITDFCAPRHKIIIEVDGSQHLDQQEYDADRTASLETSGYRVLRFWNNDVMNDIEQVIAQVLQALEKSKPAA